MKKLFFLNSLLVLTIMAFVPTISWANVDSSLLKAVQEGNSTKVMTLLDEGADANVRSEKDGWTALMIASKEGHTEIVSALLGKGADANATRDKNGWTGLIWALVDGEHKLVQESIDKGSEVSVENRRGETAIKYATLEGHTEIVNILLRNGALVDMRDMNSETPLMHASRQSEGEILQNLVDQGADLRLRNKLQETPLVLAVTNNHSNIVQMLINEVVGSSKSNGFELAPKYSDYKKNPVMQTQLVKLGKEIYEKRCWGCHGIQGDGRGPAKHLLKFKPRDFTNRSLKNKGAKVNAISHDENLIKRVTKGHTSANMPSFGDVLKKEEIKSVVGYIETFSRSLVETRP